MLVSLGILQCPNESASLEQGISRKRQLIEVPEHGVFDSHCSLESSRPAHPCSCACASHTSPQRQEQQEGESPRDAWRACRTPILHQR